MDSTILDVLKYGEDVHDLIGSEEQSRYRYTVLQIGNEKLCSDTISGTVLVYCY